MFLRNTYLYDGLCSGFCNFTDPEAKARGFGAPGKPGIISDNFLKTKINQTTTRKSKIIITAFRRQEDNPDWSTSP